MLLTRKQASIRQTLKLYIDPIIIPNQSAAHDHGILQILDAALQQASIRQKPKYLDQKRRPNKCMERSAAAHDHGVLQLLDAADQQRLAINSGAQVAAATVGARGPLARATCTHPHIICDMCMGEWSWMMVSVCFCCLRVLVSICWCSFGVSTAAAGVQR